MQVFLCISAIALCRGWKNYVVFVPVLSNYIEKSKYTCKQWHICIHTYISGFSIQFDIWPYTQLLNTQHYSSIMHNLIQTNTFGQNGYTWKSHFDNPHMHQVQSLHHLRFTPCRVQMLGIRVCQSVSTIECLHFAFCSNSFFFLMHGVHPQHTC